MSYDPVTLYRRAAGALPNESHEDVAERIAALSDQLAELRRERDEMLDQAGVLCLKCRTPHDGSQWEACEYCSKARTKKIAELKAERDAALARVEKMREALEKLRQWDMLNLPEFHPACLADQSWAQHVISDALAPASPADEKESEDG